MEECKDNCKLSLYTNKKIDFTEEPMFFGCGKNTQKFEVVKYPWYDTCNDKMQGNDWPWDEITIQEDIFQFKNVISEAASFIITRGLQRAIFLDSIQGRGPVLTFGQVATTPEMEAAITTWQHFEVNKHSKTYTKHLRALYVNPTEIFDETFKIKELTVISESISKPYNQAYKSVIDYVYYNLNNLKIDDKMMFRVKKHFLLAFMEVNLLEGVRFYTFFATIWAMDYGQQLMRELAKDLIFIARDENEHLNLTQYTIHKFKTVESEGFTEVWKEILPEIKERCYQVYEEEIAWIDYLFSKGAIMGMNANIAKEYMTYLMIKRMKAIGIEVDIDRLGGRMITKNPIKWVDDYIHNDSEEKLPQEEKITNYRANAMRNDMFGDIKSKIINKFKGVFNG